MNRELYGATRSAKKTINELLSIPATGREQDWEIEFANPKRVLEIAKVFELGDLTFDERCAAGLLLVMSIYERPDDEKIDHATLEYLHDIIVKQPAEMEALLSFINRKETLKADKLLCDIFRV